MNLLQFQEIIESRLGLYFDDSKETDLLRRIKTAMAEAKITDTYLYYTRLYNEPADSPLWLGCVDISSEPNQSRDKMKEAQIRAI